MRAEFINPFLTAANEVLESELGNVITGRAGVLLERGGITADIAPPMLIVGRGTLVTTLDMQRLVIPLETEFGKIEIQVALRLTHASGRVRVA